ncbi:MAG TPA: hypothetical protein VGP36_19060 [Mycobacteriales bacterium]|nr:hypothetical protein [Mycobacteriales bacterium]
MDVGKVVNGLGQWQVLTKLESMTVAAGSRAAPAILGCRAVYQREGGSLETAVQLLDRAIGSAQVSPGATRWLSLERAQILVRLDRNDEARTALDDLARSGFPAERLGYWFAVLDERAGRFPAVLEWTSGDQADPAVSRGAHSMAAFVLLANGRFPGAQREFWITTTVAEAATSPVMEALLREYVSWSVSWTEPERGAALAAAALEANERMGSTIGIARSLARAGGGRIRSAARRSSADGREHRTHAESGLSIGLRASTHGGGPGLRRRRRHHGSDRGSAAAL